MKKLFLFLCLSNFISCDPVAAQFLPSEINRQIYQDANTTQFPSCLPPINYHMVDEGNGEYMLHWTNRANADSILIWAYYVTGNSPNQVYTLTYTRLLPPATDSAEFPDVMICERETDFGVDVFCNGVQSFYYFLSPTHDTIHAQYGYSMFGCSHLRVYPNPSLGFVTVEGKGIIERMDGTFREDVENKTIFLDKGIYVVRNERTAKLLIVQ